MRFIPLLLTAAATLTAATPALSNDLTKRDGQAVVDAVKAISEQTTKLNTTVASYGGGIEGTVTALEIETEAVGLNNDLREAVWTAKCSDNFTDSESLAVSGAFLNLLPVVKSTLKNIVSKKDEFDDGLLGIASLSFLVKYNLETEQRLSIKLGGIVEDKLTEDYADLAPLVLGQIKTAFKNAIEAYD